VPMMTGQLVLGAKSGMAGAITGAFQNMAQEVGARAGKALTQQMSRQAEAANQAVDQALYAKNLSNSGLLAKALNAQNESARAELYQRALGVNEQGLGNQERMVSNAFQARQTDSRYGSEFATSMLSNPGNTAASLLALKLAKDANAAEFFLPINKPAQGATPSSGSAVPGALPPSTGMSAQARSDASGAFTAGAGLGGPSTGASIAGSSAQSSSLTPPITGGKNSILGDKVNQLTGAFLGGVGGGVDMAGKYWGYQLQRDSIDQTTAIAAQRGDIGVSSFYESGESQRYGREGQYLMNEAKGRAQDSAWFEKNNYAQGMAAEFGALDVNVPQIGAKSTDDSYLARTGLAGQAAQIESFFFSNVGPEQTYAMDKDASHYASRRFSSALDSYKSSLQNAFGTQSLLKMYDSQVTNATNELAMGINGMGEFVNQTLGAVGGDLNELRTQLLSNPQAAMSRVGDSFRSLMNLTSGNTAAGGSVANYGGQGRARLPGNAGIHTQVQGVNGQTVNKQQTMLEKR
jgi:hypothetical protein